MRKLLLALFAVAFTVSLSFAQSVMEPPAPTDQSTQSTSPTKIKFFSGKVKSISVGNVDKGTNSQITVTDDTRQELSFIVESGTLITGNNGSTLTFADIKNDSQVNVQYTSEADGTNKAQAIIITQQK